MKLKKAMLLFAAAAVAAGTVAGCSGSQKETTAASAEETTVQETKEETTAEETKEEETTAEEEDEENYDTGDAALDNTRNQDEIGEKELLVVSFGTSFNDSRRLTIGAIEDFKKVVRVIIRHSGICTASCYQNHGRDHSGYF